MTGRHQPVPDTHLGYTVPLDTTGIRAAWLSLPRDLTPAEAERLGRLVASLAVHLGGSVSAKLPTSINVRHPEPGFLYAPDQGEHEGHVIEFVSANGLRFNVLGEPLRSWLVRCRTCLRSWAFPPEDGGDGGELFVREDPEP